MRPPAVPTGPARAVRASLLAAAVMSLSSSCAIFGGDGEAKPRAQTFEIVSAPDANSCGKETGNSLYFRVLQVTDVSPLDGLTLAQIWDREEIVLGPALVAKVEDHVDADSSRVLSIKRDPKAKAIVVIGNFCKTEGTCWRIVHPVSAGSKLKLKVDASCLSVVKR